MLAQMPVGGVQYAHQINKGIPSNLQRVSRLITGTN
jgi:hypothetical protein